MSAFGPSSRPAPPAVECPGLCDRCRLRASVGGAVSRLLDPRAGERILDLGCGDGVLSTELALGARIHGVDASPELVIAARARCRCPGDGRPRTVVRQRVRCSVQQRGTALMGTPDRVLEGVRRAPAPATALSPEFGGHGNVATIIAAVQAARVAHGHGASTFQVFPDGRYADRLRQHGFQVQLIECTPRPTALPTGVPAGARVRRAAAGRPASRGTRYGARGRERAAGRAAAQRRRPAAGGLCGCACSPAVADLTVPPSLLMFAISYFCQAYA